MGQNPSWGITLGISLHQWNKGTPFPPGSAIFPQNLDARRPRFTLRRVCSPAGPGPGRRHPPFLPGRSARAAGDSNDRSGALTSVRVLLQVLLEQREVCAEGREERPGQRLRDTVRRPPSQPRGASPRRDPTPDSAWQPLGTVADGRARRSGCTSVAASARHPENRGPRTRHLVVAPSSSVSRVSGATWSGASRGAGGRAREGRRGGGTGRRVRARGAGRRPSAETRAERLLDAGGRAGCGPSPALPAAPCGSGAAGDPSSRLPHSSPGPAAPRSHARPEAPSSRALRMEGA